MPDVGETVSPRRAIARLGTLERRVYDLAEEFAAEGFEDLADPLGDIAESLTDLIREARQALAEGRVYLS